MLYSLPGPFSFTGQSIKLVSQQADQSHHRTSPFRGQPSTNNRLELMGKQASFFALFCPLSFIPLCHLKAWSTLSSRSIHLHEIDWVQLPAAVTYWWMQLGDQPLPVFPRLSLFSLGSPMPQGPPQSLAKRIVGHPKPNLLTNTAFFFAFPNSFSHSSLVLPGLTSQIKDFCQNPYLRPCFWE